MRIQVKVITRTSSEKIEQLSEGQYKAWLTKAPVKGEANKALIKLLANYFSVSKSAIEIVGGKTSSDKIVDVF
jgi:uncharacterized protein YggU (UPF0235/DUF167 family)